MALMDFIGRLFSPRDRPREENQPIDRDTNGNALFADDIVSDIMSKLEKRKGDRRTFELQWQLNANFLIGNQYCEINPMTGTVENYERDMLKSEHGIFNRIAPLIQTRIANIKKVDYAMTVRPRSGDMDDYEKAAVSTKVLRYLQSESGWDRRKDTLIDWLELTGTAFVLSYWDTTKGRQIAVTDGVQIGEDGQEIPFSRAVYEGDVEYGLLNCYEVYPESVYKSDMKDQRSVIVDQILSLDDIYDIYGHKCDSESCERYILTPIPGSGGYGYEAATMAVKTERCEDSAHVITYFEKPGREHPNGVTATIIGKELIYYGDLPIPEIPIISIKCVSVPGQFFGKSIIQDLIPLQRAYNGCKNKLHEYIQTVAANATLIEEGSVDNVDELIRDGIAPNQVIVYRKNARTPIKLDNGQLPGDVMAEKNQLAAEMEYAAGVSQLMAYGETPSGMTSGTAIENLASIDNTRMSLTTENIRAAVLELARIWLMLYKRNVVGYRICNIVGANDIGSAVTWTKEDINSFDVEYATENELLLTEEKQKENFLRAYEMGLFTDDNGKIPRETREKILELMKINQYSAIMSLTELQRKNAVAEQAYFEAGVIPEIGEFDDHLIHIDEHKKYVLQTRFKLYSRSNKDMADMFVQHLKAHEKAQAEIEAQKMSMLQNQMKGGNAAEAAST